MFPIHCCSSWYDVVGGICLIWLLGGYLGTPCVLDVKVSRTNFPTFPSETKEITNGQLATNDNIMLDLCLQHQSRCCFLQSILASSDVYASSLFYGLSCCCCIWYEVVGGSCLFWLEAVVRTTAWKPGCVIALAEVAAVATGTAAVETGIGPAAVLLGGCWLTVVLAKAPPTTT